MSSKQEAEQIYKAVQARKLSDIFANGFHVPDIMKPLITQTAIVKYGYNSEKKYVYDEGFCSLFDLVLNAITHYSGDCPIETDQNYCTVWEVLFAEDGVTPIGFTNTIEIQEEDRKKQQTKSFVIRGSNDFFYAYPAIQRYICTVKLMFNKGVNSNKTVLKSDLSMYNSNDLVLTNSIKTALRAKREAKAGETPANQVILKELNTPINKQMEAIAKSGVNSVLNLPIGYDLTFPNGDISQIQILYKSMQEELGAVLQMPLTKLFGTPPVGFQSTGEYDRLSYEQTLDGLANKYCVPILKEVASILNCSQEEIDSIKYLSTYQIEILMKLYNTTAGAKSPQIIELTEQYIEIKTGIKADKEEEKQEETRKKTIPEDDVDMDITDEIEE